MKKTNFWKIILRLANKSLKRILQTKMKPKPQRNFCHQKERGEDQGKQTLTEAIFSDIDEHYQLRSETREGNSNKYQEEESGSKETMRRSSGLTGCLEETKITGAIA